MKNLILILIASAMFVGAAPVAMAGVSQTGAEIDQDWKLVIKQQKKQEAKWKALEDAAARLLKRQGNGLGHSGKKSR